MKGIDDSATTRVAIALEPAAGDAWPRGVAKMLRRAHRDGGLRLRGGPLMNFAATPIVMPDPFTGRARLYRSVEHRYQAMRATTAAEHDWVAEAPDPAEAKRRGHALVARPDWEQVREAR